MNTHCAGPCTLTRKTEAGTGNLSTTFEEIKIRTQANAPQRDALLHGRVRLCRSCGCETTADHICPGCADAMRAERSEALSALCRVHRVRYVEDLPVSALEEMQAEWGRC